MYIKAGKSAGKAARTRQLAADSASRRPKHERRSLRAGRGREGRGGRELFPPPRRDCFPSLVLASGASFFFRLPPPSSLLVLARDPIFLPRVRHRGRKITLWNSASVTVDLIESRLRGYARVKRNWRGSLIEIPHRASSPGDLLDFPSFLLLTYVILIVNRISTLTSLSLSLSGFQEQSKLRRFNSEIKHTRRV